MNSSAIQYFFAQFNAHFLLVLLLHIMNAAINVTFFQEVTLNLIHFVVCDPLQSHSLQSECERGTQLMVQLVQSSELQVWVTILYNDTVQHGGVPERRTEKIEEIHRQDNREQESF